MTAFFVIKESQSFEDVLSIARINTGIISVSSYVSYISFLFSNIFLAKPNEPIHKLT